MDTIELFQTCPHCGETFPTMVTVRIETNEPWPTYREVRNQHFCGR